MTPKTYPSRELEKALRDKGANVAVMWQMKGPPNTDVAWIECMVVDNKLVIVETFSGGGWLVCTQLADSRDKTIVEQLVK